MGTLVNGPHFVYRRPILALLAEKRNRLSFQMLPFLCLLGIGLIHCSDDAYLTRKMSATSGPESDDVYQPGTPGGAWTDEEVATTRRRIFQMIYPDWDVKKDMYSSSLRTIRNQVYFNLLSLISLCSTLYPSYCAGSHHRECTAALSLP